MNDHMKILIAETDSIIIDQLINYLTQSGFEVFPAVLNGEDLMEKAKLFSPSLIITDVQLNGQLDGIEAIARLESTFKIPYIFITDDDDLSIFISSYNLNPVGIIKKPIDQVDLQRSIEKVQLYLEMV